MEKENITFGSKRDMDTNETPPPRSAHTGSLYLGIGSVYCCLQSLTDEKTFLQIQRG